MAQISLLAGSSLGAAGSSAASPVPALSWEGVSEPKTTGLGLSGFFPTIAMRQPAPAVLRDRGAAPAALCEKLGPPGREIWGGRLGNQQPSRRDFPSQGKPPGLSSTRGMEPRASLQQSWEIAPFREQPPGFITAPPQTCAVLSLPVTALRWVNPCLNTTRLISALAAFRDQEEADAAEPQSCMFLCLQ